ncbi:acetyl-CoA carboxylase biotin carboxyl carrier protein [Thermoflavimicrobium dichotomicum]|uniref:Biotin carboxyl carrier protein of acetyl-CoA carboxylase n=1 Tax=Thermoflavimicrobium dichotomicum TaxID=46223 RepID=A0A1I3SDX5_9BACL|nr:acetyl-CoA carboxylase biotin carboxyl carrier protein [Thermoflavimicrobium dichotomicum]SFJ55809.1 acetyl-CoA carboxylase biotin carboxyl carrier protein [Thermoflavimicrobium dichotomicum]
MLRMHEIREIIRLVDESGIESLELETGEGKLVIKRSVSSSIQTIAPKMNVPEKPSVTPVEIPKPAAKPIEPPFVKEEKPVENRPTNPETDSLYKITSPIVGTFYAAPSPEEPPYVQVGSKVKKDTVVCIIEAMKLFNEIEAEVEGEIVEVLVQNGQLVEIGQPLFLVKTS